MGVANRMASAMAIATSVAALPNMAQTKPLIPTYVGAPSYVCFGASVVITESEIVNYLPRATLTLGVGGKR